MTPTEFLKAEHRNILGLLEAATVMVERLKAGTAVPVDDLKDCVEFVVEYADKAHHAKEEDILFKAMVAAGVPQEGGPVGVMLMEHEQGRNYIGQVKNALPEYESRSESARNTIADNLGNYASLLQAHIFKEDNILYPMADRILPPADQEAMTTQFHEVNATIGEDKLEALVQIKERLRASYLAA